MKTKALVQNNKRHLYVRIVDILLTENVTALHIISSDGSLKYQVVYRKLYDV